MKFRRKNQFFMKVPDCGLGGEKVLWLAVFRDRLKLSRPGQAWLDSAVICLARLAQMGSAQSSSAWLGSGLAQLRSCLDWLGLAPLGLARSGPA